MARDTTLVRGTERLLARIKLIRETIDPPGLMDDIANLIKKRVLQRFDRQVDPNGVKWRPLEPSTIARKRRGGYGGKAALVRTGKLRDSIKVIRGQAGSRYTNTGLGFRIGIENPEIAKYAAVQNRGSRHVTARKFLGIGRSDIAAVEALLRRRVKRLQGI